MVFARLNQHSTAQFGAPVAKSSGPLVVPVVLKYCDVPSNNTLPDAGDMLAPNPIERVAVLLELNTPVVKITPAARVKLPDAKVYVPVVVRPYDLLNVTVPAVWVNVGTAPSVAVPSIVSAPVVNTKLVDGLRFPEVKLSVGPFCVNVVQLRVPVPKSKLPPLYVNVLEQVSVRFDRSSVPSVRAAVVHNVVAPTSVVVIPDVLITNGPIVVFVCIDPVPTMVAVNAVRTLVELGLYILLKLRLVAAIVKAVVPKLTSLNQLPVVNVAIDAPLARYSIGALVAKPPDVVPN